MRHAIPPVRLLALAGLLLLLTSTALGQRDVRLPSGLDATTLALEWVTGRYRMPVTCLRSDGSRIELEEAIVIRRAPEHGDIRTLKLTFFGIDAPNISRCYNLVTPNIPDRRGTLYVTFRSASRADTGPKDFRRRLESGELRYPIQGGQLRQREFGDEPSLARAVKFSRRGIDLVVRTINDGSDADKLLAPYAKRETRTRYRSRRFEFEIQGPDEFAFRGYFIEDPKWKR